MLRYIIRLDDATPKMNPDGWQKVEAILDRYDVKPIVGIIPDSKDTLFHWPEDSTFWSSTVQRWIGKNWTIAQHGYHHVYHPCKNGSHSEFSDLSYEKQMNKIKSGYDLLTVKGCQPTCFFAPGHTFDSTTVAVCRDFGKFEFISDGYALYPYQENGMLFFPSIFDTPHRLLPFGVYTFILHPSFASQSGLTKLEQFVSQNVSHFRPVPEIMASCDKTRQRNALEIRIHPSIVAIRRTRKKLFNR